jgi:hypothetical protein
MSEPFIRGSLTGRLLPTARCTLLLCVCVCASVCVRVCACVCVCPKQGRSLLAYTCKYCLQTFGLKAYLLAEVRSQENCCAKSMQQG